MASNTVAGVEMACYVGQRTYRRHKQAQAVAIMGHAWGRMAAASKRWSGRAAEPHILFPAIAAVVLAVIWGTTLNLVRVERAAAEHAAAVSVRELAETYEAQVVRALREIDQTLKLVKYAYESTHQRAVLQDLRAKTLLPPELLFVVSIADSRGEVIASTKASEASNIAGREYFETQRHSDALAVGLPVRREGAASGAAEWGLQFSRRLVAPDGSFNGVVMIGIDAAYFVSGYDASKLGEHGLLGLLGADGVFRARRSGEAVTAGDRVDYTAVAPAAATEDSPARVAVDAWDGVRRYTSAMRLYNFPLAVIVGLSRDEQLADARNRMHAYAWRAGGVSLLLLLVISVLARMSRQLTLTRRLAAEEQAAHATRVEYLAYHDDLTTLPNRSLFSRLLVQSMHLAHRQKRPLAVLFLDLDRFKQINDTLGHEAGDQLLQDVAIRLRACVRDSDVVARLGGDEFVIMLPDPGEGKYESVVAQKVLSALAAPFILGGEEFRVTASIGIATYPQDGLDEPSLTKNADIAMYQAKAQGKNNFQFFSEKLNSASRQRLTLESGLRHAVERHEFQLHYQAKRHILSGQITGLEALLRWQHPGLGTVSPLQFIPVAEETGLIVPIGKWVLGTACLQNVAWQKAGLPRLGMSVHLAARQFFDEHLLADLGAVLAASGMDANLLELEVAENLLMRNVEKALGVLGKLKNMGIRIAIDDFGAGYSSLAALRMFPIDTIKIDRSLIRDSTSAPEERSLTGAIIAMGKALSLTVVAQGVETKEQADFLRRNACDEFQGYYLNRPVPAGDMAELLRSQSKQVDGVSLPE